MCAIISRYRTDIEILAQAFDGILPEEIAKALGARVEQLNKVGIPSGLARRIADLHPLAAASDIALVASRIRRPAMDVGANYFAAIVFFGLDRIISAAHDIRLSDDFDRLALDRALDQIGDSLRRLAADMTGAGAPGRDALESWAEGHPQRWWSTRVSACERSLAPRLRSPS